MRKLIALSIAYLLIQTLFIGVPQIGGSSEAREAQVVDVILRAGANDSASWVLPLRNGVVPSKPPLYHWLSAGIALLFGRSDEFTLRLTSELCAAICLIAVGLTTISFARLSSSYHSKDHPTRAAITSFMILSLTYGFFQMAGQAMVDTTFVCCLWCALAAATYGADRLVIFRRQHVLHNQRLTLGVNRGSYIAFWSFLALAILSRGPIGLALPLALVGIALLCVVGFKGALLISLRPSIGWLALVVPLSWYVAAYGVGGEPFIERQLFFENVKRFSGGEFVNSEPWWFYLPSLLRISFPWWLLLLILAPRSLRAESSNFSYPDWPWRVRWLPTIVLLSGVFLLSLSSGKRHSYLIPLLPFIAIQLGVELSSIFERSGARLRAGLILLGSRLNALLIAISLALLLSVVVGYEFEVGLGSYLRDAIRVSLKPLVSRLALVMLVASVLASVKLRRSIFESYLSVWFLALILMSASVSSGLAIKGRLKGFSEMAQSWLATINEGESLAVFKHPFDEYFDPILYYVRRDVRILPLESASRECGSRVVYAAKKRWLDENQRHFRGDVVRVLTVREPVMALRSDDSRDLVYFRCFRGSLGRNRSRESESGNNFLRDAGFIFGE